MGELPQQTQRWLSFESSLLSYSHRLHFPFSLDPLQKVVALTVTALDSGGPLARAGDQISSSFSQLAAGKGHTRCLASVMWCPTRCATSEISLADGTGATTALVARIAKGVKGEPELVRGGNPKNCPNVPESFVMYKQVQNRFTILTYQITRFASSVVFTKTLNRQQNL